MFKKLLFTAFFTLSCSAFAGNVQVFWEAPEKYTDVFPAQEKKHSYQKEVFSTFEQHFKKLAKQLPKDKTLYISVKNLDLAGAVTFANSHKIRVVKESTPPRIVFSFQLIDEDNKLLVSRSVDLQNANYKFTRSLDVNRPYYHDLAQLTDWFESTFAPIVKS